MKNKLYARDMHTVSHVHCFQEALILHMIKFYEGKSAKLTSSFSCLFYRKTFYNHAFILFLFFLNQSIHKIHISKVVIFSKWQFLWWDGPVLALRLNACDEKLIYFDKDKRLSVAWAGNKSRAEWDALTKMLTCECSLWISSKLILHLQACQLKLSDAF